MAAPCRELHDSLSALLRDIDSLPIAPVETRPVRFESASLDPSLVSVGSVCEASTRSAEGLIFDRDDLQLATLQRPLRFALTPARESPDLVADEALAIAALTRVVAYAGPAEDTPLPYDVSPAPEGNSVHVSVLLPSGKDATRITVSRVTVAGGQVPLSPSPLVVPILPFVTHATLVRAGWSWRRSLCRGCIIFTCFDGPAVQSCICGRCMRR
jgi:hypothetical protein